MAEAKSTLEIGKHPWAGLTVMMVLEATDVAGQKGESLPFEFTLPQRRFDNPFARAIIEQRRKLVADWRYRDQVAQALDALTLEPDMFIDDTQVYLALRAMYYRLNRDRTREGRNSIIEQLWDTAVRIEDGGLSDAERRLRAAQDQLAKLLKEQASEEDVKQAMKELQKALENFMQQRQKQAEKNGENQPGKDKDSQVISQEDLERMMQEIEENIKNGTREEAQQMLSDLRDILDKMRSSQQADDQFKHNQEMKEKLDKLSEVIDDQKQLMDETFDRRRAKQSGQRSNSEMSQAQAQAGRQQGQNAGQRQGQRSQQSSGGQSNRRSGQRSRRGQSGQRPGQQQAMGQPSQQQQQGQPGQGSVDRLSQRQKALRRQLGGVQREFDELGHGRPDYLNRARRAMDNASEALQKDQLAEATRQQARALEQMRQSSQELVREMMENSPQQYGQGESESRDPLGRPQAFRGPNDGRSVKVPTQIDRQRAREILEELRKRIGELQRPDLELQYIERLLRRF